MPGPNIPEIKWEIIRDKTDIPNIVPVVETILMSGHNLGFDCKCSPEVRKYPNVVIIIHQVIN